MTIVIYLALIAVGFYFGKWLGAIGLVAIYFFFFHSRQLLKTPDRPTLSATKTTDLSWAYHELGVSQSADSDSIKRARKRLLNHYHPDKLGQATAQEKNAAEQKINSINRAYAAIKQHKGF